MRIATNLATLLVMLAWAIEEPTALLFDYFPALDAAFDVWGPE